MTTARTVESNRSSSAIAHSSLVGPHAHAFSFSGRSNTISATGPSERSSRTNGLPVVLISARGSIVAPSSGVVMVAG